MAGISQALRDRLLQAGETADKPWTVIMLRCARDALSVARLSPKSVRCVITHIGHNQAVSAFSSHPLSLSY